jgi:hypothetical protein
MYMGMAENASLFKMDTQEVVEMLNGQWMPSPVEMLASVITITFVGSKRLPMDWLMKMFQVRQGVVYWALVWLKINNPIYNNIQIDTNQLSDLLEDGVLEALLMIVCQEEYDEIAEEEWESYLADEEVEDVSMNGRDKDGEEWYLIHELTRADYLLMCFFFFSKKKKWTPCYSYLIYWGARLWAGKDVDWWSFTLCIGNCGIIDMAMKVVMPSFMGLNLYLIYLGQAGIVAIWARIILWWMALQN